MRVISVINLKGGVGKTTTVVNMAYELAEQHGYKVLILDNDKQGNISRLFKAHDGDEEECAMSKVFSGKSGAEVIKHTEYENIDIITADMSLLNVSSQIVGEYRKIGEFLKKIDTIGGNDYREYDYVLIDNPPTIDFYVINALYCTDDVIVPVKLDQWALDGMESIKEKVDEMREYNPSINFTGIVITTFQKSDLSIEEETRIREESGYPVFTTRIRRSEKVNESTFKEKPVIECSPRCGASRDYKKLVNEYLKIVEES